VSHDVDYSIIVPAYNEEEMLPRTLQALRAAMGSIEGLCGELIVVDNNSCDRSADVAAAHGARVVFESVNQISRARNRGGQAAEGENLIFVDADTVASPELVAAALTELGSGKVCGGGALVGTGDQLTPSVARALRIWNWLSRRFRWAAGSFVFCRRQAWQDVGGFSLEVYASEEVIFSRAVRKWGRKRGQVFKILDRKVDTSMRKAEWYTESQLLGMALRFVLCPWLLRSRKHCGLWYDRPGLEDS